MASLSCFCSVRRTGSCIYLLLGAACLTYFAGAIQEVQVGNHTAHPKTAQSGLRAVEVHADGVLRMEPATKVDFLLVSEKTTAASAHRAATLSLLAEPSTTAMKQDEMIKLIHQFNARIDVDSERAVDRKREGSSENPKWRYMATPCMQERYNVAADRLATAQCRRVLEVGGYTSPVVDNAHFKRGELYVNVDPSTSHADGKVEGSFARLVAPVTLQDFVATLNSKNTTGLSSIHVPFDCLLIMGAWRPHFKTHADKVAFATVTKHANMVILETAQCTNFAGISLGSPILTNLGFASTEKKAWDCTGDKESVALSQRPNHFGSHLVRHMEVFTRAEML